MSENNTVLFYKSPASYWEAALPLGNGRIGAMYFGNPEQERFALNEDTLWSGLPEKEYNHQVWRFLPKARELIAHRQFTEAERLVTGYMLDHDCQSYLPAGDLLLDFNFNAPYHDYSRQLDLNTAVATTGFTVGNTEYTRQCFISYPRQIMAIKLSASRPGMLNFSVKLVSELKNETHIHTSGIALDAVCPVHNRRDVICWTTPDGKPGIAYRMALAIGANDGCVESTEDCLRIANATNVTIFLAIESNFVDYKTMPGTQGLPPAPKCAMRLNAIEGMSFDDLLQEHINDYQALFKRSSLDFPAKDDDTLPTDERLRLAEKQDSVSPNLIALLYNFGRYLLIASSRPGTQPANLQGIWNRHLCPPWGSNYTTNINLEMNYWPSETTGLSECSEPLFQMLQDYSEKGATAAQSLYGRPGWCLHHNSDIWRYATLATGYAQWAYWNVAGGWLCRHLYEHFLFSNDVDFLKKYYPIIRGSAEFLLSMLVENDAHELVTSPSTSPENVFYDPVTHSKCAVCAGSQMDMCIVAENFREVLDSARILHISDDPLVSRIAEALPRLKKARVGQYGELLEFGEDFEEVEIHHRHVSHLYGIFPGDEFTSEQNKPLLNAGKITLQRRGDDSTGWAMGWRAALWARLKDGNHVCAILKNLLRVVEPSSEHAQSGGIYINCLDAHPPFQIDGNFGVAAAIAEMLLQSHRTTQQGLRIIELLPALPDEWNTGKIKGLRARGGLVIDIEWNNTRVIADITAQNTTSFLVEYHEKTLQLDLQTAECRHIQFTTTAIP